MTEHLTITNTDRRKKILLLQAEIENLKHKGRADGPASGKYWDLAHAIRWALGYVQRHINLETGEIRAVNPEPAEVE